MTNDTQAQLWNGPAGHAWVDAQEHLDHLFAPLEALLVEAVRARGTPQRVLDVGCGTGGTTLAVARLPGQALRNVVGIDLSEPMLALARARAAREALSASFIRADAESHAFEPASFDMFISRFGVMFFADPERAFANLLRAASPGAALSCSVWRGPADNPFMTTAERAAAPLLPNLPVRAPDGPGQFAFAEPSRVRPILQAAGWRDIELQPIDVTCSMPESALLLYVTRLGPVGLALREADEHTRSEVTAVVRAAFEPYVRGAEVQFRAACWQLSARAP